MPSSSRATLGVCFTLGVLAASLSTPLLAQSPAAQSGKEITIDRLFRPPSLGGRTTQGIEWAPDSKRFSYLDRQGSGQNAELQLWTMDAATGERTVLVNAATLKSVMQPEKANTSQSTGLGRVQADNYLWSPDADSLLFIGSNSLVLLDLKTMTPKSILTSEQEIEDPKFSPDSHWISFSRNANLFVVNISSGAVTALTTGGSEELLKGKLDWVYPEELDTRTAYWWSPDSTKIAYYEMDERPVTRYPIMDMSSPTGGTEYTRYPQAGEANPIVRVGVVSISGGETKWLDTGKDTDVYLAARELAARQPPRCHATPPSRAKSARPAVRRRRHRRLENDPHRVRQILDQHQRRPLLFLRQQTLPLVQRTHRLPPFLSLRSDGKELAQLTSGEWAISDLGGFGPGSASHPAVDEASGYIYFTTNKDNVRETQLYRVSLRDKSLTRITQDAGSHSAKIAPDASAFIDTYSTAATPSRQDLYRMDGTKVAVVNEGKVPELAEYQLAPLEFVEVTADDGSKLNASIIKPLNFDPAKKYPVLINVYGGPHVQLVRNDLGRP